MTICNLCQWNDMISDEYGAILYCTRRGIYGDIMEDMRDCLYFNIELKGVKEDGN